MAPKVGEGKNVRHNTRAPRKSNSKKRKVDESPPVIIPEPKRKCIEKKSLDGREIDRYCWMCHKLGQDEKCFTCPRVYHTQCLKKASNVFSEEGVCPECLMDSIDGTKLSKTLTCKRLKVLLLAATKQRKSGIPKKDYGIHKIFLSWPQNLGGDELVRVIDFQILIDKINDIVPYTKTSEFFSDVKWMQHNCYVLYGANSKVTDAAVKLVKAFKTDLLDLEACPECYYHMLCSTSADFFVRMCDPVHDIIWAQVSGYPYWPAKCLKIVGGNAHVRFFGRHEIGDIPLTQCYFISKEHPNYNQRSVPKTPKYNASIMQLRQYVALYERTFGRESFHYYPQRTPFIPENAVPKPGRKEEEEAPPVTKTSKPNIANLPLCIDLIAQGDGTTFRDERDEPSTSNAAPVTSNAVTVSMTFSEEQSRTGNNDFDSSASFTSTSLDSTYDAPQSIDIESRIATTVVTSTPIVATSDTVLNMSSDDLSLGAEFSNSNPVEQPVENNDIMPNNFCNLSRTSQMLLQAVCNASEELLNKVNGKIRTSPRYDFADELSKVFGGFSGSATGSCFGSCRYEDEDEDDVVILESPDPVPLPINNPDPKIDDALIVSYLFSQYRGMDTEDGRNSGVGSQRSSRDSALPFFMTCGKRDPLLEILKTAIYSLFINMWSLANSAPSVSKVLITVIMDLKKQHDCCTQLKKENDDLKLSIANHQSVVDKLQEQITSLKLSLEEMKRKNEKMQMEFTDATRNAKLVVDSVKRSSDNLWDLKFKEYSTIYNQKLAEKENAVSQFEGVLGKLQSDYTTLKAQKEAIENMYQSAVNELSVLTSNPKFCTGTQTEIHHNDIFLGADLEKCLETNTRTVKHNTEQEANEQIRQAKINTFCYACLKPANIHCCMSANYCTKSCQRKHSRTHAKFCQKPKETRPRQESDVVQHPQFCAPMINQLNQTQTYSRKKTSIRVEFEQSSDLISTSNKDFVYPPIPSPALNAPLNLMTTHPLDRYVLKPPLLPTPPPVISPSELMCLTANARRHT